MAVISFASYLSNNVRYILPNKVKFVRSPISIANRWSNTYDPHNTSYDTVEINSSCDVEVNFSK